MNKNNNKQTLRKNPLLPPGYLHTHTHFFVLQCPCLVLQSVPLVRQGHCSRLGQCPVVPVVPLGSHLSVPTQADTQAPAPAQPAASAAASAQSCSSLCPPPVRSPLSSCSGLVVPFLGAYHLFLNVFTEAHLSGLEAPQTALVGAAVSCLLDLAGNGYVRHSLQSLPTDATPAAPHPTHPPPKSTNYAQHNMYYIVWVFTYV